MHVQIFQGMKTHFIHYVGFNTFISIPLDILLVLPTDVFIHYLLAI